ncbi:MAG: glycoside hydrolase family protein [Azoarcus sp.]|jgi:GH24 family phage-related lysozyme (muramidase)|nr:glycoside hydrolase family protein [Azoarcus sp.]
MYRALTASWVQRYTAIGASRKTLLADVLGWNVACGVPKFFWRKSGWLRGDSTLLKKLNVSDYAGAVDQFPLWNKGNGKVLPGLITRRAKERSLFLEG